jgi:hypothetical protein
MGDSVEAQQVPMNSLNTLTEPIAGPSGIGGEDIDNLSRDVKKLHVRGKRASGAEKRRRQKERARKEGTLTLEKSDNETSAGESLVAKRKRETGETPPGSTRPAKLAKNSGITKKKYSDAVRDSLKVAVVKKRDDASHEDLTQEEVEYIKDGLMQALDSITDHEGTKPGFLDTNFSHGHFEVNCADSLSLDWLKDQIQKMSDCGNLKLSVKTKDELPKITRATIFLPGKLVEDRIALSRISTQNAGLKTSSWRVYHSGRQTEKGRLIVVGLDEVSVKVVKAQNSAVYYGLQKIAVRMKSSTTAP